MRFLKYVLFGVFCLSIAIIAGTGITEESKVQSINRAVIKIDTLSCGGCFSTISEGLIPLEGYSGMGANLFRKLIAVDFVAPLTKEKISEKLVEVGYPGIIEYVDPISEKESFAYIEAKRTGFAPGGGGSCCSSGGSPGAAVQGSSNSILPSGGSCCTLPPSALQQTEDL